MRWVFLLLIACTARGSEAGLPLVGSCELTGSFHRDTQTEPPYAWSRAHPNVQPFDSDARTGIGTLRTAKFQTPDELHFFVSGWPGEPGIRIYLFDQQRQRSLDLTMRPDPRHYWAMHFWKLPKDWQGRSARLIVEDRNSAEGRWVGITLPEGGGQTLLLSLLRAGLRNGLLIAYGLLFLIPGLAACAALGRVGFVFDLRRAACAILAASSLCAWCVFGVYLLSPSAGKFSALAISAAACVTLLIMRRSLFAGQRALRRELAACLAAVFLAGTFSCSLGYLYTSDSRAAEFAQVRYRSMPPDNVLPEMLAERMYTGRSVFPTLFLYWHSSDRPPLQSAIDLLERPLFPQGKEPLTYQSLGIFLQSFWVAGLWVLLRSAGLSIRHVAFAVAFCLLSYFCLVHSFYVWAKLLSAAFCLLSLSFFTEPRPAWTRFDGILAGAALAFALLCHPGIGFTLLAILFLAVITRRLPTLPVALAAVAAILVIDLPWVAYQKLYDPPGDNLLKAHLAGIIDFQHSLIDCLITAYRRLTFEQWLSNKLANFRALFFYLSPDPETPRQTFISNSFYALFFSAGLLNAGFLVRLRRRGNPEALRFAGHLLAITAVSLVIWCLVMFEPASTVMHQGSFANVLLLFTGLAIWLFEGAPRLALALLAVQALVIFPLYAFTWPASARPGTLGDAPADSMMALFAALSLLGLALVFRQMDRTPPAVSPR